MLLSRIQFIILITLFSFYIPISHAQTNNVTENSDPNKDLNQLFTQAKIAYSLERYEEAYRQFQEILAIDPNYYDIYEEYGILEAYLDNYSVALNYFQGAYQAFPEKTYLLSMIGEVLNNLGRHQEAGQYYEQHALNSTGDEQKQAYFNAWRSYWRAEDSKKTIELVDLLQTLDIEVSDHIELMVSKVSLLVSERKKEEALTAMDELIANVKNQKASSEEINTLKEVKTFIYRELNDTLGLIEIHKQYLQERPIDDDFFKHNYVRLMQLNQLDYTDSIARNFLLNKELEEPQRLLPLYALLEANYSDSLPIIQELMEIALREENITASVAYLKAQMIYSFTHIDTLQEDQRIKTIHQIISWYDKALSLDSKNLDIYINYIEFLIENDELELAKKPLNLLKSIPELEQGFYYFYNGIIHLEKDQKKEAINSFTKGIALKNDESEYKQTLDRLFYINLAALHYDLKEYDLSEQYYEDLLQLDPNNAYAMNNLSYLYALQKRKLDRAEELAKTAVASDPQNIYYLDTYAWVLHQLERNLEARQILNHVLTLINDELESTHVYYEHLAAIEAALGNHSRARNLYLKAIENGGDHKELTKKINALYP